MTYIYSYMPGPPLFVTRLRMRLNPWTEIEAFLTVSSLSTFTGHLVIKFWRDGMFFFHWIFYDLWDWALNFFTRFLASYRRLELSKELRRVERMIFTMSRKNDKFKFGKMFVFALKIWPKFWQKSHCFLSQNFLQMFKQIFLPYHFQSFIFHFAFL